MLRLIKADTKRFIKDKLLLIACIIGLVFAIITPLLYKVLFGGILGLEGEDLGMITSAKSIFFSSFSLSNNFGLIVPIFIIVIICKDFSYGTVRNKIICGHSRTNIFLSVFITSTIYISLLMVAHAIVSGGLSLLLFETSLADVTKQEVTYFILSFVFEILVLIFVAALVSFFSVFMKNAGLAIVVFAALVIGLGSINMILNLAVGILQYDEQYKTIVKILETVSLCNLIGNNASLIGVGSQYSNNQIIYIVLSSIIFTSLVVFLGIQSFKRKDIK